ncbi:roadblock/LC7 domain-containing protein [Streptomyces murinus]|uniref:roadblock/LC7 domain-containing protein n=1 Tax=Streptomyces murinus TaxID=33900 RepID=UPI0038224D2C
MNITSDTANTAGNDGAGPAQEMDWLLRQFAANTPGVTHAVLLSRDGMRLLDSDIDKDWADSLAAVFSGLASLAANVPGPTNEPASVSQLLVERTDCVVLLRSAGGTTAFPHQLGVTDTILAVITSPDADINNVAYEMDRLVRVFASFMEVPVRVTAVAGDEAR